MAKSKNGGSRAFIRGRLGSDVYSVGKNGLGERQQVVRSLAEQVSNPRTTAQMQGRMIMSTVMQAVSALALIVDHSFDGIATGQPSISEFIRINYGLVKADVLAHPSSLNSFGLNMYQEKGAKSGKWQVSAGSIAIPAAVTASTAAISVNMGAGSKTVGALRSLLGFSNDGFLTYVGINENGQGVFFRVHIKASASGETVITAENAAEVFDFEGNKFVSVSIADSYLSFSPTDESECLCYGVIVSDKVNGAWKHSTTVLNWTDVPTYTADTALPTYPIGSDMFLNGGDL